MLPFVSLAAASATGPGTSRDFEDVRTTHRMVIAVTGAPTAYRVYFEGSLDSTTWLRLGELNESLAAIAATVAGSPLRYVRANLDTLSGGSSPTVTATIAST